MNSAANRVLLGCVLACAAGAVAIALGAPGVAGAVVTAALVGLTLLSGGGESARPAPRAETWHPVQVVTRAALLAVAVTAGASLVAYGMNQGSSPTTSNVGGNESQQFPAPGATFAPVEDQRRSPEVEPSSVEALLTESPTDSPTESPTDSTTDTGTDEPTPREPKPSANPEPTPSAEPSPSQSPSPSPTPTPTETESGQGCLLGLVCPPKG